MSQSISSEIAYKAPMFRRTFIAAIGGAVITTACAKSAKLTDSGWARSGDNANPINHDAWDKILTAYGHAAKDGVNRIDYKGLKANAAADLNAYIKALESVKISDYPRSEQFAYWVNLYNATTVQVIVKRYPIKSIRDIGIVGQGPWNDKLLVVEGKSLSLDNIEHGILRPIWKDARIHFAVNCASIGCPNLALKAYRAATLEPMLEDAAQMYVNHPRGFAQIDGKIIASNIFEWYQSDWGNEAGVLSFARKYATGQTAAFLKDATSIGGYDYNWSLNDIV